MFTFLSSFLQKNNIDHFASLPISACRILRPYLLERSGITEGSVVLLAIPYFTKNSNSEDRNLSAYAVSRDYHLFFKTLYGELLPLLSERFPQSRFACFADHSPIDEVEAAAKAGLGVIGKNHMLLTPKYSSYIFLGEIFTDAILPATEHPVRSCEGCGACMAACPAKELGTCLSALTQKKGVLADEECRSILRYGSVWGCDICQEVCPHTKRAIASGTIYSPIPFFSEDAITRLTSEQLAEMDDQRFSERAYAWRGRNTIERNLYLFEKGEESCSS